MTSHSKSKGSGIKNWLIIHAKDGEVQLEGSKLTRHREDGPHCYLYLNVKEVQWLIAELGKASAELAQAAVNQEGVDDAGGDPNAD